jgi:DNA-binding transcriptional LysR family regulator
VVIDLRKLKHLVTVARVGSLSKATEELHISQPALSRSIAVVEEELGIRIFDRSHNGVALTSLGKLAVAEAEKLLNQSRIFDHNLNLYCRGESGKVSFGMWPLIGSLVLPGLSTHFISRHPDLKMWAAVKSANALLKELHDGEIEILFCGEGQFEITADLQVETIGEVTLAVMVRNGHPLTSRKIVSRAELFEFPLLCAIELSQVPAEFMNGGIFVCENFDVLRHAALNTDSYWLAPLQMAQQELAAGTLKEITVIDQPERPKVDICMVQLRGYELSPAAQNIAAYVRDFFAVTDSCSS